MENNNITNELKKYLDDLTLRIKEQQQVAKSERLKLERMRIERKQKDKALTILVGRITVSRIGRPRKAKPVNVQLPTQ